MRQADRELLGLVPLEDSSGQRRRLGHITKQGDSLLRFLLVEAAQVTVRSLPEWRSKYCHLTMRAAQRVPKLQQTWVSQSRRLEHRIEQAARESLSSSTQEPRVFYRENSPRFVIAKSATKP